MKRIRRPTAMLMACMLLLLLASCGQADRPSPSKPVTLTVWHTYVEGMQSAFDNLLSEFNQTVGAENGITVKVTSVANSAEQTEGLLAAARGDPGAAEMPDMTVVYPKVAVTLAELGVLADIGAQFSEEEKSAYVAQFWDEGCLDGDTLYIMPIAKTTEVLYLNKTVFDRFSEATGVGQEQLATFEGIADTAMRYYEWTDAQTPDVPDDGKLFYYPDGLFNYAMIGMEQLGGSIVKDGALNLSDPLFERIWDSYFGPVVQGGTIVYNDYANYLFQAGEIVCATSTSAGSVYYPNTVTYADNTKENIEILVLPFPVFEGGESVAVQRGGGICVAKSTPAKEYAAGVFLKWFTEPEHNLRFTAGTGYMPVSVAAFEEVMAGNLPNIENETIEKTLLTTVEMFNSGRFYFPPVYDGFAEQQTGFVRQLQQTAEDARREFLRLREDGEADAWQTVSDGALEQFLREYQR